MNATVPDLLPPDMRNELGRFVHGTHWCHVMSQLKDATEELRLELDQASALQLDRFKTTRVRLFWTGHWYFAGWTVVSERQLSYDLQSFGLYRNFHEAKVVEKKLNSLIKF